MTWTLAPDDRDRYYRATRRRSPRHSVGKVIYPLEFWDYARPIVARTPGDDSTRVERRDSAREPESPISRLSSWYMARQWPAIALLAIGIALIGATVVLATWTVTL